MQQKTRKIAVWVASAAVVLVFVFGLFFSFLRWFETQYFGKVIAVQGTTFSIEDKEVGKREFFVTPKTKLAKGRKKIPMPSVGDEVIVIGKMTNSGGIEALGVRVVENKFRKTSK